MQRVDKEFRDDMIRSCDDYVYSSNNGHLRKRYCFLVDGEFICVEGNTNGWFRETTITSFSGAYYWVNNT